ncbi:GLIPR1-like protein 1 [Trichinella pseudospiralis]|uniref:GLIPR1-like protein 1 n=2 Tax=Trichinella pseudospiralis TaxID=6337 RepID=A0A0V1KCE0_TRIPS|nr:GLIPR1-like protein 1 [Trichinella pseudospiralis]
MRLLIFSLLCTLIFIHAKGSFSLFFDYFGLGGRLLIGRPLSMNAREAILNYHNKLRQDLAHGKVHGQPKAVNMQKLKWSKSLAAKAFAWASKCHYDHSDLKSYCGTAGFYNVGENIAYASLSNENIEDESEVIRLMKETAQDWWNEYTDFHYESRGCSSVCSHYTQMASATVDKVGCAFTVCQPLSGVNWSGRAYFMVCNYGNGDNWGDRPPYITGPKINCPPTHPIVENGLCSGKRKLPKHLCKDVKSPKDCQFWKSIEKTALQHVVCVKQSELHKEILD